MDHKLRPPAIAMLVSAAIGALGAVFVVLDAIFGERDLRNLPSFLRVPDNRSFEMPSEGFIRAVDVALGAMFFLISLFVAFAAIRMLQRRQWLVALFGAIALLIPCTTVSCCSCGLGIGVGIWALVILSNDEVKKSFTA